MLQKAIGLGQMYKSYKHKCYMTGLHDREKENGKAEVKRETLSADGWIISKSTGCPKKKILIFLFF